MGPLTISTENGLTWATVTSGKSAIGTKANDDGTNSVVFMTPGFFGFPLIMGERDGKRVLILMDAQHEYVFTEDAA